MLKHSPCKYCGAKWHTSLMCFSKKRTPIRTEADKTKSKRTKFRREWLKLNPPNDKGVWICYLQISPQCPIKLTASTIQLEHVKSRARYPQLRYNLGNIKPACKYCNKLKGSRDLEELNV